MKRGTRNVAVGVALCLLGVIAFVAGVLVCVVGALHAAESNGIDGVSAAVVLIGTAVFSISAALFTYGVARTSHGGVTFDTVSTCASFARFLSYVSALWLVPSVVMLFSGSGALPWAISAMVSALFLYVGARCADDLDQDALDVWRDTHAQ